MKTAEKYNPVPIDLDCVRRTRGSFGRFPKVEPTWFAEFFYRGYHTIATVVLIDIDYRINHIMSNALSMTLGVSTQLFGFTETTSAAAIVNKSSS